MFLLESTDVLSIRNIIIVHISVINMFIMFLTIFNDNIGSLEMLSLLIYVLSPNKQ